MTMRCSRIPGRASRSRASTAAPCAPWCQNSISGTARSGSGRSPSRPRTSRVSGKCAATTCAAIPGRRSDMAESNAHGFSFSTIEGAPLPLDHFRGKPVLVVNTASFCGYTPQYTDLETLHQRYAGRGLIVLGVPSNDFGAQEPGTATEIKQFCSMNYHVTLPLAAKEHD